MSNRSHLIRRAAELPKGSTERRSILRSLKASRNPHILREWEGMAKHLTSEIQSLYEDLIQAQKKAHKWVMDFEGAYHNARQDWVRRTGRHEDEWVDTPEGEAWSEAYQFIDLLDGNLDDSALVKALSIAERDWERFLGQFHVS